MVDPLPTRPATQLAPPVLLDTAFDEPDRVLALIYQGAPYKTLSAVQKEPRTADTAPWFRNFWALGGKVLLPQARPFFENPRFVGAARESFRASVIQPLAMMTNLNPPCAAGAPHLDLPFFRGAHRREVPLWMLAPMGYSGLFQRWAIPVASALAWFYRGPGGEFEYWPQGLAKTSHRVKPAADNAAVVADNEYMYHRVCQVGADSDFLPDNRVPYEALLERADGGWMIRDQDQVLRHYEDDKVRLSVLWKAFFFADQTQANAWLADADNLTPDLIVEIFQRDLAHRGVRLDSPARLDGHGAWADAVRATYQPA